jgi:beta-galactosidase
MRKIGFGKWLLAVAVMVGLSCWAAERTVLPLESGWRFHLGEVPGAEQPGFADAAWDAVTVPHTWNAQDGQTRKYHRGIGWYRLTLKPQVQPGRRLFLRFEAASIIAQVYVNGEKVGEHRGAFGAFCFEITKFVKPGIAAVVAVQVDNSHQADIAPLAGDFNMFGGLYRPAALLVLDEPCITPLDYASPGIYIRQEKVATAQADLAITAKLSQAGAAAVPVTISASIVDAAGHEVAKATTEATLPPQATTPVVLKAAVPNPHLWNGRADPYLYAVTVTVARDGKIVDAVTQPLGIRTFEFDKARGFLLNGVVTPMRGVNRHQDRDNKGWAVSEADHLQDIEMICEIGANALRLAHYQHSETIYRLCDQKGILVWAELPCVNLLNTTDAFKANAAEQLRELIRQNYNHPSIFCWSLWNELLNGARLSKEERPKTIEAWCGIVKELNDIARQEDPDRKTACATNSSTKLNQIADLLAWNRYPGWYGPLGGLGGGGFGAISEYGAGANILHHEQGRTKGPDTRGQWHPEEWQAIAHEKAYASFAKEPLKWGSFIWNMFDFSADNRNEGAIPGRNDKGLVTYDRKIRKDAFFFYQANWRQDIPVVYITSRRDTPRKTATTPVKVYSNCPDLKVTVNGNPLPPVTGSNGVFVWNDIPLNPGKNTIEATGTRNGKTERDACTWERIGEK